MRLFLNFGTSCNHIILKLYIVCDSVIMSIGTIFCVNTGIIIPSSHIAYTQNITDENFKTMHAGLIYQLLHH